MSTFYQSEYVQVGFRRLCLIKASPKKLFEFISKSRCEVQTGQLPLSVFLGSEKTGQSESAQEEKTGERQGHLRTLLLKASSSLFYGLRARMNALTNLPSTSGRSSGESASMEALAPFPTMSARE